MSERRQHSSAEYWRNYLRTHGRRQNLALHLLGVGLAIVFATCWLMTFENVLLLSAAFCFFAFGWLGHIVFQHDAPDQFRHPLRSVVSDVRLFMLWCTGMLADELTRYGVSQRGDVHVGPNRRGSSDTRGEGKHGKRRRRRRASASSEQRA